MNDRELLELAAKAAGAIAPSAPSQRGEIHQAPSGNFSRLGMDGNFHSWNPLDDDGDALRLAVKLRMVIDCDDCEVLHPHVRIGYFVIDDAKSLRRAIVRAAAAIGEKL